MLNHTPFPTADVMTVNSNQNVTKPNQRVRQRNVVYLHNFIITQQIVNSLVYKF